MSKTPSYIFFINWLVLLYSETVSFIFAEKRKPNQTLVSASADALKEIESRRVNY